MPIAASLLLGWVLAGTEPLVDVARLRELLHDRQQPRAQDQAALALVQARSSEAEEVVRKGLRQPEESEAFLSLAAAVRLQGDERFLEELAAALTASRPAVRQGAAEALAALTGEKLVPRLRTIAEDATAALPSRQAAAWALGRCGRKDAVPPLLALLESDKELLRRAASEALADLSGQALGVDLARWKVWWEQHKSVSAERWLESRLAYHTARTARLEGELERTRSQVVRLHQQLYARLPSADRLAYIQTMPDQDDPAVRSLAVTWALELWPVADQTKQKSLGHMLLRLSYDGTVEVQRGAVLGLGRVNETDALDRLFILVKDGPSPVRAAAARSLAQQARATGPNAGERRKKVVPALQAALGDPALEVVLEAAEDLGALGESEAGPVLTGLLKHPSEPVRRTAAQALERVADATVLDALLDGLSDPGATIRFALVGAVAHAMGDGSGLEDAARKKVVSRLETLLLKDADPGVRSRSAAALGDVGTAALLPTLWDCVLAGEDTRVQEKAWAAFVDILGRSANVRLVEEWDRKLAKAKQGGRRVQLMTELSGRWLKRPEAKEQAAATQGLLVEAQLDQGKWATALPLVREQLARPGTDAELNRRLKWLLTAGEQALKEGNHNEVLRVIRDAQPYLPKTGELPAAFEELAKRACPPD